MKREKLTIINTCDFCPSKKEAEASYICDNCGKGACFNHREKFKEFQHDVSFSGSGDMTLCGDCYREMKTANDPMLLKFETIQSLRLEATAWSNDFQTRSAKAAEAVRGYKPKFSRWS